MIKVPVSTLKSLFFDLLLYYEFMSTRYRTVIFTQSLMRTCSRSCEYKTKLYWYVTLRLTILLLGARYIASNLSMTRLSHNSDILAC